MNWVLDSESPITDESMGLPSKTNKYTVSVLLLCIFYATVELAIASSLLVTHSQTLPF